MFDDLRKLLVNRRFYPDFIRHKAGISFSLYWNEVSINAFECTTFCVRSRNSAGFPTYKTSSYIYIFTSLSSNSNRQFVIYEFICIISVESLMNFIIFVYPIHFVFWMGHLLSGVYTQMDLTGWNIQNIDYQQTISLLDIYILAYWINLNFLPNGLKISCICFISILYILCGKNRKY